MSSPFSFEQIKRLNDAVSKGDYANSIIHYTSEDSLTKIISGNELWMGRIDQMNDATEFTHYAEAVKLVAHQLVPQAPVSMLNTLLGALEEQIKGATYLSSWSEYQVNEPEGRLPMWITYGNNAGGVAAVVDSTQMQPSSITAAKINYFVYTSQVEYVRKEKVSDTASMLIERVRTSEVLQNIPNSEAVLGAMLMARAPTSKHHTFNEEREVRFLTMPKFLANNGRFVPTDRIRNVGPKEFFSLELRDWPDFDLDLRLSTILQKILIGPRNMPIERADRMRRLLKQYNLEHVPVEIVDIPLRD